MTAGKVTIKAIQKGSLMGQLIIKQRSANRTDSATHLAQVYETFVLESAPTFVMVKAVAEVVYENTSPA